MAWNPSPKVADCREIARKWGSKHQVIILAIDRDAGTLQLATYGETKALCASAKALGEAAYNAVADAYDPDAEASRPRETTMRNDEMRSGSAGTAESACSPPNVSGSAFLSHVHHAYAKTDGSYDWPNSREGDMLRQAKREIEALKRREQMCATIRRTHE